MGSAPAGLEIRPWSESCSVVDRTSYLEDVDKDSMEGVIGLYAWGTVMTRCAPFTLVERAVD